jgi:predicted nuclease of predicted toxin-antitoxin system
MKLLADENIPSSIIRVLQEEGYDIRWIRTDNPASLISMLCGMHTRTRGSS